MSTLTLDKTRSTVTVKPTLWLASLLFVFFAGWAIQLNYWGLWLLSKGQSDTEVGLVVAVGLLGRAIVSAAVYPAMLRRFDAQGTLRILVTAAAAFSALFSAVGGLVGLALISFLFGATFPVVMPLTETLLSRAAAARSITYGTVRLWGSIGFIAGVGLASGAADLWGNHAIVYAIDLVCLVLLGHAVFLWPSKDAFTADQGRKPGRRRLGAQFVAVLCIAALVQGSHAAYFLFAAVTIQSNIRNPLAASGVFALAICFEIVGFRSFSRLSDERAVPVLLLSGAIAGLLRWTMIAMHPSLWAIVLGQPLHALTFAGTHYAFATYVRCHVPPSRWAFAHGAYAAAAMSLAVAGASLVAGAAAHGSAVAAAYWWMAGLAATGVLIAIPVVRSVVKPAKGLPSVHA